MRHPEEQLLDYALEMLPAEEAAELEEHLETCAVCRKELYRLNASLVQVVETLPAAAPPEGTWERIRDRLTEESVERAPKATSSEVSSTPISRPFHYPYPWTLAAVLFLLLAVGGTLWGYRSHQAYQQVVQEQRVVAGWLSQPEVQAFPLQDPDGESLVGSILLRPDGQALFVLHEPAAEGRAYQAWGHREDEDELVSLRLSQRPVFEVSWHGYERLYFSLEPEEGSPQPTLPLGKLDL